MTNYYGVVLGLLALVGMPASADCKTFSVDQMTLSKALLDAQPGDHIVLAPGGYGVIVFPKRAWGRPIIVDASKALMTGMVLRQVSGVTILGGSIIGSTGYGVHIADSSRIAISRMDISGADRGIVVASSDDVQLTANKLHGLRTDGIDVVGRRIMIEQNRIYDMRPQAGDHPDGVQIWSASGRATTDVTVRGNNISGVMQGIFARAPDLGTQRLTVTQNLVNVTYPNGIVLLDTANSLATGNSVRSPYSATNKANMRVVGRENMACGNIVPDVPTAPAALPC